ncbi:MAG: hypothetical protein WDA07_04325 [Leucobacter sp.]
MDEIHVHTEIVRVVARASDPVLHSTASNRARREAALTALNGSCSTEELESLAGIASYADIPALEREARRRWGGA